MRVLFLTSRFPDRPIGGDRLRAVNLIRHLSRRFEVDLFSLCASESDTFHDEALRSMVRSVHAHRIPRWRRLWNTAKGWLRGLPLQTAYYTDDSARARLRELLATHEYDAVVVHLVRMLEYVKDLPRDKVILEMTDAISFNYSRIRRPVMPREILYMIERKRLRKYELAALKTVARAVLVSYEDVRWLVRHGADPSAMTVIRNGTDFAGLPPSLHYDPDRIVFLGNMRTTQNEDMCLWFVSEILPIIRKARPGTHFVVAGANPSRRLRSLHGRNGVTVTGYVDSAADALSESAVSVCPMRYGAGMQNKILESMAVGVPVVTTGCGADGLGLRNKNVLLFSDTPEGFAREVLRILDDKTLRFELGSRSAAMAAEQFRWVDHMQAYVRLIEATTALATAPQPLPTLTTSPLPSVVFAQTSAAVAAGGPEAAEVKALIEAA